ncbi:Biogenesis of lysosome-related organelles complex 1 subunit 1 [Caenorhabditis elegans]|uniref:Biogenesis of lysosome-related organelles complex 1 subunit 1 n=1 Tax=Caenorhabditis elegans TaxID=6239 RepID=Q4TT85_CAEEL|nr:Biogenesis of lysosome-related organelles complex 1 subunit 1 [Caenorhabditis elegans]CCD64942.1 Biogenesis of lysosome-related organelles complex 1 subunit 1 [Caenorhabditis elegans]|eukprot:NP_001022492.1 Uncharacterized protein CELE_ZC239.20 [Caenorhabditis elegans]
MSFFSCYPGFSSENSTSSNSSPPALEEQLLQKSKTSERKSQNISVAELNFLNGRFGAISATAQLEVLDEKIKIWKKLEHIAIAELNLMSLNLVHEVRANTGKSFEGVTGIMKQQVALAEKSMQIVDQNLLEAVMNRNLVEIKCFEIICSFLI